MKKIKKKLSGMTLVEMIISLAIFAVLALVLVTMGNAVEKNTQAANKLNKKVAVDGPIAEVQNSKKSYIANESHIIKVANAAEVQTNANGDWSGGYISIQGTMCYVQEGLTNATETNTDGKLQIVTDPNAESKDFDFNYIIVTRPTGTTTAASSTTSTTTAQQQGGE